MNTTILESTDPSTTSLSDSPSPVRYRRATAGGLSIFYREAGSPKNPTLLLIHGFPTSSHMFRDLIDDLSDRYHIVAPDLPGFGFSDAPSAAEFGYTFDRLADVMAGLVETLGLENYALYVFDYGAPVGFRLAMKFPERVTALITQNGNAYEEGLGDSRNPIQAYWQDPTEENRNAIRTMLTLETTKWQYTHGVSDESLVAPESYTLDHALLSRSGNDEIQLDLFLDCRNNVARYPEFQAYFREHLPPVLAVWGRNDPFFLPPGADAYRRDVPGAEIHFFETGHFALETHHREIAETIKSFLNKVLAVD